MNYLLANRIKKIHSTQFIHSPNPYIVRNLQKIPSVQRKIQNFPIPNQNFKHQLIKTNTKTNTTSKTASQTKNPSKKNPILIIFSTALDRSTGGFPASENRRIFALFSSFKRVFPLRVRSYVSCIVLRVFCNNVSLSVRCSSQMR